MKILDFIAHLNTAHTFNTFCSISLKGKFSIPVIFRYLFFKGNLQDPEIVRQTLKGTVSAADADCTVAVMLGKDQFDIGPSCLHGFRTVGMDHHPFLYLVIAGSDKLCVSFHLHRTDAAGADLIDILQIAQRRNPDSRGCGSLKNCIVFLCLNALSIDRNLYHFSTLPPLKIPNPK